MPGQALHHVCNLAGLISQHIQGRGVSMRQEHIGELLRDGF
ncbi:hypothetical protein LINPERPRIM_LOCUS44112 [Linum perenne]